MVSTQKLVLKKYAPGSKIFIRMYQNQGCQTKPAYFETRCIFFQTNFCVKTLDSSRSFECQEHYNQNNFFFKLFSGPEMLHVLWALWEKLQMGSNLSGSHHIPLRTLRRGVLKLFVKILTFWTTLVFFHLM